MSPRSALALALFAVAYGTNVATPLFLVYENTLSLSTWTLTALFAIYPLGLAPALAWSGPASDVKGRRSLVAVGVALSGVASSVMLFGSSSVVPLYIGRLLLGAVSGAVFVVASAWMQELAGTTTKQRSWIARLLSLTMYGGFACGPLVTGVLAQWTARPLVWPYVVHLALVVAGGVALFVVPETVTASDRPIRPNLGLPVDGRRRLVSLIVPTALGVFCLPSLAFGLFPVLLRPHMAEVAVFVTGIIFASSMGLVIPAQAWVGRVGPHRAAPMGLFVGAVGASMGLGSVLTGWWPLLFPGSALLGFSSGVSMTSGLRIVDLTAKPDERGALTGFFYAVAYAGMTAPLLASSLARLVGFASVIAAFVLVGVMLAFWLRRVTQAEPVGSVVTPDG